MVLLVVVGCWFNVVVVVGGGGGWLDGLLIGSLMVDLCV